MTQNEDDIITALPDFALSSSTQRHRPEISCLRMMGGIFNRIQQERRIGKKKNAVKGMEGTKDFGKLGVEEYVTPCCAVIEK